MNTSFTFETKNQLAKLLATENITMQHNANVRTAYFDVKNRMLVLPVWQGISEDLYDMLVVHEVGHALDTDADAWLNGIDTIASKHSNNPSDQIKSAVKDYLNVVEDARIDKRQKRRYPGSRKNYVKGYAELHDRDFFKLRGKDINSLSFIDRANIYFKGGIAFNIKFNAQEKALIARMENAETFDDVLDITNAVFTYARTDEKQKRQETLEQALDLSEQEQSSELNGDEEFDDQDYDFDDASSSDGNYFAESEEEKTSSTSNKNDEIVASVETEKAAEDNISTIITSDDTEYFYVDIPKMHHNLIVDNYGLVYTQMMQEFNTNKNNYWFDDAKKKIALNELQNWKIKEKETISFMIKEFEMKKAADAYARTAIAKTGTLDTNKIHSYKYNEDIFKRVTTVATGKNHGFVMFLDWSGSMLSELRNTLKQLFSLVMFAKQMQIPFDVYLFRSLSYHDGNVVNGDVKQWENPTNNAYIVFEKFKLRNILSSKMTLSMLHKSMECLWIQSYISSKYDPMDRTPLNQAILAADYVINDFRKKNKVQIVNTIFLTDGASDCIRLSRGSTKKKVNYIFRDPITKKTYYITKANDHYGITSTFLRVLKDRTQSNVIGFFLSNESLNRMTYMFDNSVLTNPEVVSSWKTNKFFATSTAGYDQYYVINTRQLDVLLQETLKVDSKMSKSKITKEFMKYSSKKSINRVLLSKFIDTIAK